MQQITQKTQAFSQNRSKSFVLQKSENASQQISQYQTFKSSVQQQQSETSNHREPFKQLSINNQKHSFDSNYQYANDQYYGGGNESIKMSFINDKLTPVSQMSHQQSYRGFQAKNSFILIQDDVKTERSVDRGRNQKKSLIVSPKFQLTQTDPPTCYGSINPSQASILDQDKLQEDSISHKQITYLPKPNQQENLQTSSSSVNIKGRNINTRKKSFFTTNNSSKPPLVKNQSQINKQSTQNLTIADFNRQALYNNQKTYKFQGSFNVSSMSNSSSSLADPNSNCYLDTHINLLNDNIDEKRSIEETQEQSKVYESNSLIQRASSLLSKTGNEQLELFRKKEIQLEQDQLNDQDKRSLLNHKLDLKKNSKSFNQLDVQKDRSILGMDSEADTSADFDFMLEENFVACRCLCEPRLIERNKETQESKCSIF